MNRVDYMRKKFWMTMHVSSELIKKVMHKCNIQELNHMRDALCISYCELEALKGRNPVESPRV